MSQHSATRAATSCSPAPTTIPIPSRAWSGWVSATPRASRRRCADGITAASRRPAARAPVSCSPSSCRPSSARSPHTADPDSAFRKLDEFLAGLPSGVQPFLLLHDNPGLLAQLAEILGSAPRIAEHLSRSPDLLEGLISGDLHQRLPDRDELIDDLARTLAPAGDYDDAARRRAALAARARVPGGHADSAGRRGGRSSSPARSPISPTR